VKPRIVENDPWLNPYSDSIVRRIARAKAKEKELLRNSPSLYDFATGYLYYGLHRLPDKWVFREWAPNATAIFLIGEFSGWQEQPEYQLKKLKNGNWEIELALDKLINNQLYKMSVHWNGGQGERIPAWVRRCVQDDGSKIFNAQVWDPGQPFQWKIEKFERPFSHPLIYEAHVGMATEDETVGTYIEFKDRILPRVIQAGYNTLQLMAIQEHPYYGSFGYHVSNFFAPSSRFGTPEELKELIDEAHANGMAVIMDIVHSHAVRNELEGLAKLDGTRTQYFHGGPRGEHIAWDSFCFDYGKNEVLHFLLSNCKYWMEEFKFDGFRFDGVTSMLYYDHGLSRDFGSYDMYFDGGQDEDAISYFILANQLIHQVNKKAITVAEEMSGMPGLAAPIDAGGIGFDYRMAMGVPDYWIKIIKERGDEEWDVSQIFHELTSRRAEEHTVSYAESHDQALVGDKTIIFRLLDKEMYWHMNKDSVNLTVDRGMALHKIIRLVTCSTGGGAYLNFMGNEFGHPEWIDFPREGNNWSFKYARRQWSLFDNKSLRYHFLGDFDREMLKVVKENNIFDHPYCYLVLDNRGDQVLAYSRGDLLFVYNFSPTKAYTDYGISVGGGKYHIILDTDSSKFGGFGLIDENMTYFSQKHGKVSSGSPFFIKLYLPPRVGLVLKKMPTKSVYDVGL
jgi:1,4-alpha-glucan branching enzyme